MLSKLIHITKNMGIKYVLFRSWYEFKKKTGLLKLQFPINPKKLPPVNLEDWKKKDFPFFFRSREDLVKIEISDKAKQQLKEEYDKICKNQYSFFSSLQYSIQPDDWLTNPDSGYTYPLLHWTKIPDFDPDKGDIKYVWERSRFSFLYTIIRYDYHFNQDSSEMVFGLIRSWMKHNPLNTGPNYVCSQEISIRCMNWTFALFFYRNAQNLTKEFLQEILESIYNQTLHVKRNIKFSTIAVRNNHSITETLWLFLSGLIFPFFPGTEKRVRYGKKLFEREVNYQFELDGGYIQNSFNYQRVALQVCLWGMVIGGKSNNLFATRTIGKIHSSVVLLHNMMHEQTGQLPNYGANDGALFFPLNSLDFRNYKGQINALKYYFDRVVPFGNKDELEDVSWLFNGQEVSIRESALATNQFNESGYYILRSEEQDYYAFIRCNKNKKRPSHADNLHLDIWCQGKNILRDSGSYKYNTKEELINYFAGTAGHNTLMIHGENQMKKGPRFVWFHWSQAKYGKIFNEKHAQVFEGRIQAFKQLGEGIEHKRLVRQNKNEPFWEIEDTIFGTDFPVEQVWNISPEFESMGFQMECFDINDEQIEPEYRNGWYSGYYGVKEPSRQIVFSTSGRYLRTQITKK